MTKDELSLKVFYTLSKFVSQFGAVWAEDGKTILCNKLHIGHEFCPLLEEYVKIPPTRLISG